MNQTRPISKSSRQSNRAKAKLTMACGLAVAGFSLAAANTARAANTVYLYSPTATATTTPDSWNNGNGWTPSPLAGLTTELNFSTGTLATGSVAVSNNDITGGNFVLNTLDLTGTTTIATGQLQISGNPLEFNGSSPVVNLTATNGNGFTYNVSNNLQLDTNTTFTGNGTDSYSNGGEGFMFGGVISGTGNINKSGSSVLVLDGNNVFTTGASINIAQGTVRVGSSTAGSGVYTLATTGTLTIASGATYQSGNYPGGLPGSSGDAVSALYGAGTVASGSSRPLFVDYNGALTDTFTGTVTSAITKAGSGVLTLGTSINTGGGNANVYDGTLNATAITNTGTFAVEYGTLHLNASSGVVLSTYVGTNVDQLQAGGRLEIVPSGTGAAVSLTGNTGAGNSSQGAQVRCFGGTLDLDRTTNASLTLTLGNVTATAKAEILVGAENGLIIQPLASGDSNVSAGAALAMLGSTGTNAVKLLVTQGFTPTSAGDATYITNGMVPGNIVGQNNDSGLSASFLTYNTSNGFTPVAYDVTDTFSGSSNTSKVWVDSSTNASTGTASAYALRVDGVVAQTASTTLYVGANTGEAGVILNGGTIQPASGTSTLNFQASEGAVYVSAANGTIASNLVSAGGNSMVVNGPGVLFLTGTNSGLSGLVTISGSTLDASGTAVPAGVLVLRNGVFESSGTFNRSLGTSAGNVEWEAASSNGYGGGGFAARGGKLTVTIGGSNPTNLVWNNDNPNGTTTTGTTYFLPDGQGYGSALLFGSTTADSLVNFTNNLDLGSPTVNYTRIINVANNPNSTTDVAEMSGVISSISPTNILDKTGAGILWLSNANTYAGGTVLSAGTLQVGNNSALGTGGLTINAGELSSASTAAYSLSNPLTFNGDATLGDTINTGALTFTGAVALVANNNASSGTRTLTVSSPVTFAGVVANGTNPYGNANPTITSALTKAGSGTLTLSAANTYSGGTTINAGSLSVTNTTGSGTGTGPVVVNTGGILGGTGAISGLVTVNNGAALAPGAATTGTLTFNGGLTFNTGSQSLVFALNGIGNSDEIVVPGVNALTTSGAVGSDVINVTAGFTPGTYTLLQYNGSIGGGGYNAFALSPRIIGALSNNTSNSTIVLNLTSVETSIKWTGAAGSGVWDINTTQNWKTATLSNPTTYLQPTTPGDNVTFDDSAALAYTNITPASNLSPASVTFNNSSLAYTLSGSYGITGTTGLTKLGSSSLLIDNPNTFSGATTISGGTVEVGSTGSLASPNYAVTSAALQVDSGGVLNGSPSVTATSGTLTFNSSTAISSLSGDALSTLALGATLTVNGAGASTFSGTVSGTGGLTLTGGGSLALAAANTFSGTTTLSSGTLQITNALALQDSTVSLGAGTLSFGSLSPTLGGLSGTGHLVIPSGQTVTVGSNNASTSFSGTVNNSAGSILTKVGTGVLTMTENASVTGTVNLNAGTIQPGAAAGGLLQYASVVMNGGILDMSLISTNNPYLGALSGSGNLNINTPGLAKFLAVGYLNLNTVYSGVLSGAINNSGGGLSLHDGSLTLTNANTFTGGVSIQGGTLIISNDDNLGAFTGSGDTTDSLMFDSGTLQVTAGITSARAVSINSGGTFNTSSYASVLSGNINGSNAAPFNVIGTGSLTLTGTNTYSAPTTVSGGTLALGSAKALPTGNSLTIGTGAEVVANNLGTAFASTVSSLAITGTGILDLRNNDIVVHNALAVGTNLNTVTGLTTTGYNNGAWNGPGGIISTAASQNTSHLTALGVIVNDSNGAAGGGSILYGSGGSIASTFGGVAPAIDDVLVKYTYYGDANLDGRVDGSDYSTIDSTFLKEKTSGSIGGWQNGDFNYDGVVNGSDYTLIDNAFNTQGVQIAAEIATPTAQIAGSGATAAVPEPTTLGLLGIGAIGLLGRRRRR